MSDISRQIWDMKYRFKAADGTPIDRDVPQTWARVALAAAEAEAPGKREEWALAFGDALAGHRFIPAGRILAGAGTARTVTLFNCFVMGAIPDDMGGIFAHLREAALTMQQGGGIGYDFSTLRPKGAPVSGVGADASGPVSFMGVWDAMCRTIMSAGSRRGAMMATLACDHPDIELFVDAKRTAGQLTMFNLSVLASDAFMEAVKSDSEWNLQFGGRIYRSLPARALWDRIMRATYDSAEPGVIFIDRINRENNLGYCETIRATNPCLPGDTWVMTADGPRQICELVGKPFAAVVEGRAWQSDKRGFFAQGSKPVLAIRTRDGYRLRATPNHLIRRVARRSCWNKETEWIAAGELRVGDEILIHDHRAASPWGDNGRASHEHAEGYLLGLVVGDGVLKADKGVLSAWPGRRAVNGDGETPGVRAVMDAAFKAALQLSNRSDFTGWMEASGRGEYQLSLPVLESLAHAHGILPGIKQITPVAERRSAAFHCGLLRGLFDSDGSVQGTRTGGVSVCLAQSDLELLEAAQRMLLGLGIASSLRSAALPAGGGGVQGYRTRSPHELVISGDNAQYFSDRIGFADTAKQTQLKAALSANCRSVGREKFCTTIESIEDSGITEVFDACIPGLNAFDANGIWVHNCGEQPLPPYGACLLGSINLAKLVRDPFADDARLDEKELSRLTRVAVRLLDDIIDVSRFPLPEQRQEAIAKRRIGLGVTGLADALIFCRARYGAPESLVLIDRWLETLSHAAYAASAGIAREKGAFPLFDRDAYLARSNIRTLPQATRDAIAAHGIRNGLLTSIAPTGTISLFAENVSSGIEPVFAYHYARNVLLPDGSRCAETVADYAWMKFREMFGADAALPDYFATAQTLTPDDHLAIQAAAQKHVDSSISKTINVPAAISFDTFKDVYLRAYETGCKGCTTYRPSNIRGAVLETAETAAAAASEAEGEGREPSLPLSLPTAATHAFEEAGGVVYMTRPLDRPEVLLGQTYKIKWPDSDHAFYITMNDLETDGRRRPFEVFINSKNMEAYAWTLALTRMISAVFRRGGDVSFVVHELKAVFDPRGGQWMNGQYVPSLLAAIGEVIERHLVATGFMPARETLGEPQTPQALAIAAGEVRGRLCPRCGSPALVRQEGCDTCIACGFSRCG